MKMADIKVTLVDSMGSDLTVVNAARVSFDKESNWLFGDDGWSTQLKESDASLISYLAEHNHWSPFAHTSIQIRVKAPIFVARQLVKHQVGGVWNEISRRYVSSEPEFWFPELWRGRPQGSIKQGSAGQADDQPVWDSAFKEVCRSAVSLYTRAIQQGVAPEQARMILPQNAMTEWYWTGSLAFFNRVCTERLASSAQYETTLVARLIDEIMVDLFPVSWIALAFASDKQSK